jgi:hypothetical protein
MEYQSFSPNTAFLGRSAALFGKVLPDNEMIRGLLIKNKIHQVQPDDWYPVQDGLNFLKDISSNIGPNMLFAMGKATGESALLPPEINDIPSAIQACNYALSLSHKGEIGNIVLHDFNPEQSTAVIECHTPYPSEFERGFFIQFLRKFRNPGSSISVETDLSRESRTKGGDRCFYNISW